MVLKVLLLTHLVVVPLLAVASASNISTTVSREPAGEALQGGDADQKIQQLLLKVSGFAELSAAASRAGVDVSLVGFTAIQYYSYAADSIRRDQDPSQYLPTSFDFQLRHIFLKGEKLRFELRGNAENFAKIADQLNKIVAFDNFDAEIQASHLQKQADSVNSFADFEFHINGKQTNDFSIVREGVAKFEIRKLDGIDDRAHMRARLLETISYLKNVFAANLRFDATSILNLKSFITQFPVDQMKVDPARLSDPYLRQKKTSEDQFQTLLNTRLESMFETAYDHADAAETIKQIGLFDKVSQLGEFKFLNRTVLPKKVETSAKRVGRTASEIGLKILNHQIATKSNSDEPFDPYVFEVLTKNPQGLANAVISSSKFGVAHYGEGFYLSQNQSHYYEQKGWVIYYELAPTARDGVDFFVTNEGFVVVQNRDVLRLAPRSPEKFSNTSFHDLLQITLSRFLPQMNSLVNVGEKTELTSDKIYDAFLILKQKSQSLSPQEKQVFTSYIDLIESGVRDRKVLLPEVYRLIFELNFEENYLGDQAAYLKKSYTYLSKAEVYLKWLKRKYRYDSGAAARAKLRAAVELLSEDKKKLALHDLRIHESRLTDMTQAHSQSASGRLQCIDAFAGIH